MKLSLINFLVPETVIADMKVAKRSDSIRGLLSLLCDHKKITDRKVVLKDLMDREKKMSTGIGSGVAVPHCRTSGTDRAVAAFARIPEGVNFMSVDKIPVKLVFLLVSPLDVNDQHIRALARISRILGDRSIRSKLLRAGTSDDIYRIIKAEDAKRT